MVTSSSTPGRLLSSARPIHLAAGGKDGVLRVDLARRLPAPAGVFLVKRLILADGTEVRDVHRLEELVIVGSHKAIAAIVDRDFHAGERSRYFGRLDRLRLLGSFNEHAYLVDSPRVEQCHSDFGAERLLELLGRRIGFV